MNFQEKERTNKQTSCSRLRSREGLIQRKYARVPARAQEAKLGPPLRPPVALPMKDLTFPNVLLQPLVIDPEFRACPCFPSSQGLRNFQGLFAVLFANLLSIRDFALVSFTNLSIVCKFSGQGFIKTVGDYGVKNQVLPLLDLMKLFLCVS